MDLEEQAPLLRGCPDRGGERQAKGGAQTLRSNDWREARAAHFASRASVFEEHVGKQGGAREEHPRMAWIYRRLWRNKPLC